MAPGFNQMPPPQFNMAQVNPMMPPPGAGMPVYGQSVMAPAGGFVTQPMGAMIVQPQPMP